MLYFDRAPLACLAYGQVVGATGLSPNMNSGVTTARTGTGTYTITIPAGLYEDEAHTITMVQVKGATPLFNCCNADDSNPAIKRVFIGSSATTAVDADFSFVIWKSIRFPPAGSPA